MDRRAFMVGIAAACVPYAHAASEITNIRFGTLRPTPGGGYEVANEIRRIPHRYKDTGFRFGIGFDNPRCEPIEWYEVIYLPKDLKEVSGNFQRTSGKNLRTKTFTSDQASVVDDFWFDPGDPLGKHKLELYVNGVLRYAVEFEVVADK